MRMLSENGLREGLLRNRLQQSRVYDGAENSCTGFTYIDSYAHQGI